MSRLSELITAHSPLSAEHTAVLERVVEEWHLIADLSFSDLVLWVPEDDPEIFRAVAQARPATGVTSLEDDLVGARIAYEPEHPVVVAAMTREPFDAGGNKLQAGVPVDVHAIPLVRDDTLIGIVECHTNQMAVRSPSRLEDSYLDIAHVLMDMLAEGTFPRAAEHPFDPTVSPRVGDGLVWTTPDGLVQYASPNAVTVYRRLGGTADLVDQPVHRLGRDYLPVGTDDIRDDFWELGIDLELDLASAEHDVILRVRILRLVGAGRSLGVLVLLRDVTELRRRERLLVSKDATIREIHHRVKNNLQNVAALLRMQSRRIQSPDGREALAEAMSRVAAIAVVHETLARTYDEDVDFDSVAASVVAMVGDVMPADGEITATVEGSFGLIPPSLATNLSLMITELTQNAIEHGLGGHAGHVVVRPERDGDLLTVSVIDDGRGLPEGFTLDADRTSLGLAIVGALVRDLGGRFVMENNPEGGGARAVVSLDVGRAQTPV